jgi:hypothetical protein
MTGAGADPDRTIPAAGEDVREIATTEDTASFRIFIATDVSVCPVVHPIPDAGIVRVIFQMNVDPFGTMIGTFLGRIAVVSSPVSTNVDRSIVVM